MQGPGRIPVSSCVSHGQDLCPCGPPSSTRVPLTGRGPSTGRRDVTGVGGILVGVQRDEGPEVDRRYGGVVGRETWTRSVDGT